MGMAVFSFGRDAEKIWTGAGWAFRQMLRDLSTYAANDPEMIQTLQQAEHLGSLVVDVLEPELQRRIREAVVRMCDELLNGRRESTIAAFHGDLATQRLYRQELEMLRLAVS